MPVPEHTHLNRARGLTLVEIMVALAISMILMAGVIQIFLNSKTSYNLNEGLSRLQENGRFAVDFISRDLRNAGFYGCIDGPQLLVNALNNADSALYNFAQGIAGFDSSPGGGASTWSPPLPSGVGSVAPGTDVLIARVVGGEGAVLSAGMVGNGGTLQLASAPPAGLGQNRFALVTDCAGSAVFQVTGVESNALEHDLGGGATPGNAQLSLGRAYPAGAEIWPMRSVIYFVRNDPITEVPYLIRQEPPRPAQAILEGVEALQVLYGEDLPDAAGQLDGIANRYVNADAVTDFNNVVSVRLGLLLSTVDPVNADAPDVPYQVLDATYGPFNDGRLRHVFTATVELRNR